MAFSFSFAAEVGERLSNDLSVRVSLGSAPGIDEVKDSTGTYDFDDDGGARLEILGIKRFWDANNPVLGLSVGGGFFFGCHALSTPGFDVDITAFGLMAQGGIVVDMGNGLTLEFGPYLGTGTAYNQTEDFSDGTGPYYLYGIKGSTFMVFNENIEIGVDVGYEGFIHKQKYDFGFGTEEATYRGHGARVALVFGVAF